MTPIGSSLRLRLGVLLILASTALWGGVLAVPFLGLGLARASALAGGLVVSAEVLWWLGALLTGPDVMRWLWRWIPWRRRVASSDPPPT